MTVYNIDECVLLDNKNKNAVKIEPTEISIETFGAGGATEIEIRGILRDYDWEPNRRKGVAMIVELKYCPKCKRLMIGETIRSAGGYIIRWHCLCGHIEEETVRK